MRLFCQVINKQLIISQMMQEFDESNLKPLFRREYCEFILRGLPLPIIQEIIALQARREFVQIQYLNQSWVENIIKIYLVLFNDGQERPQVESGTESQQSGENGRTISELSSAQERHLQYINEHLRMLTRQSQNFRNPYDICIQLQLSLMEFGIFLFVFIKLYKNAQMLIQVQKDRFLIRIRGLISPAFKEDFHVFVNLLIFKSNVDYLILHDNTDEQHHCKLYEKLAVMKAIKFLNWLPLNGEEQRQIKKESLLKLKDYILNEPLLPSELASLPNCIRRNKQETTSGQIMLRQDIGLFEEALQPASQEGQFFRMVEPYDLQDFQGWSIYSNMAVHINVYLLYPERIITEEEYRLHEEFWADLGLHIPIIVYRLNLDRNLGGSFQCIQRE